MKQAMMRGGALAFFLAAGLAMSRAETYTYPQLVKRLTDLEQVSETPAAGEKGALASSYDRASQYDAAADKYLAWDANSDGQGIIRKEGEQIVMAEIKGPGCIWRTWSATPAEGHVKIYLDGAEKPVIDLPFSAYFDGKSEPFTRTNIAYRTTANGFDNYTPIPFQKSCKIVADPRWGNYYHFNYTQFPPGTVVPTFKLPLSAEDGAALDEANRILGNCGQDPAGNRPGQKSESKTVTVEPGKSGTVVDLDGAGAITALRCHIDGIPQGIDEQANFLRRLAVRITWDKQTAPAVWAPIGDFFADAAGPAPYSSLVTGFTKDKDGQFYCYWYMPFASHAALAVDNDSAKPVTMSWEVVHAPLTKPIASLMRFHAKWHRDAFPTDRKDRWPDWTLLTTKGKGRFVGTQLHIWNPRGGWWGEGDEKFFVDGEKFPSTIGTGSEDYFGYAWSTGAPFNQALHGQSVNEDNRGHVSVHRWHIADNIPFQQSFEASLEKYFQNDRPTFFAAVAYWYLSDDGTDPYTPVPVSERVGYMVRIQPYREPGVLEGESLKILSGRELGPQMLEPNDVSKWSGDAQLWWRPETVGAKLELEVPVTKAGKYRMIVRCTKARDYGIVQSAMDGTKLGTPIDLYEGNVVPTDPIDLGVVTLTAGAHVLSFEVTGKNSASSKFFFGLDYLKLVPVP